MIKIVAGWIDSGLESATIRKKFKEIDDAIKIENPITRANTLNGIFRG